MTLATDYLLGTLCEACGILLLKHNTSLRQTSIRLWALALVAAAMGSYAGGTYHGFQHALSLPVAAMLWKVTTISMGIASFLLLAAAITAAFAGQDRRWLLAGAALKLTIYVVWMLGHDEFRFVIYDYGSTLVILMLLVGCGAHTRRERTSRVHRVRHSRVDRGGRSAAERHPSASAFQSQRPDARRADGRHVAALQGWRSTSGQDPRFRRIR